MRPQGPGIDSSYVSLTPNPVVLRKNFADEQSTRISDHDQFRHIEPTMLTSTTAFQLLEDSDHRFHVVQGLS